MCSMVCNREEIYEYLVRLELTITIKLNVIETLRIAPTAFLMAKTCSEPIEIHDYNGKLVKIEKGTCIQLPLYAVHHDADHYPEPDTYKPERFDTKSLQEFREKGLFLPFGKGPRICLGEHSAHF